MVEMVFLYKDFDGLDYLFIYENKLEFDCEFALKDKKCQQLRPLGTLAGMLKKM